MLFENLREAEEYAEERGVDIKNYTDTDSGVFVEFSSTHARAVIVNNQHCGRKRMAVIGAPIEMCRLYLADRKKSKDRYTFVVDNALKVEYNSAVAIAGKMRRSGRDWQAIEVN